MKADPSGTICGPRNLCLHAGYEPLAPPLLLLSPPSISSLPYVPMVSLFWQHAASTLAFPLCAQQGTLDESTGVRDGVVLRRDCARVVHAGSEQHHKNVVLGPGGFRLRAMSDSQAIARMATWHASSMCLICIMCPGA